MSVHQLASTIRRMFRRQRPATAPTRTSSRRLGVETLEDRSVPTASASGMITGVAYIDNNGNGIQEAQERTMPGVTINLTGKTTQGNVIAATAVTDGNGAFRFLNAQPGRYQVTASAQGFLGDDVSVGGLDLPDGVIIGAPVDVGGGQTVNRGASFRGLAPAFVNLTQFFNITSGGDFPFGSGGIGTALLSFRENNAPTLRSAIANVMVTAPTASTKTAVDLDGAFTDADFTNSLVRMVTSEGNIDIELFDKDAPRYVANFFNYVTTNRWDNTFFQRHATNFALQGGRFQLDTDPTTLTDFAADPSVPNEFSASRPNIRGTLSMAKQPMSPDSASKEFFFNLADNTTALGPTSPTNPGSGGFTVFGRIVGSDTTGTSSSEATVNRITNTTNFPIRDQSNFSSSLDTIPLKGYTGTNDDPAFPTNATAGNFALIKDMQVLRRDEALKFSVLSNSNTAVVTAAVVNNRLILSYPQPGVTGTSTITVRATDRFGASVDASFMVTRN